ncbi:hypothetical protein DNAM5_2 [Haloarcula californiae tailed virus 1]|uniref:Uncharacterized protein n=1 Tax=Haloarcula californiae tailed virus 1 TaxID=1273746 RepID=R4TA97_9CAUD|nr:hypothetical protein M202_gp002 [Haloarcula californiae tailed virus 1]AGM11865.1 hypothetical protein DNAM5_2 [Haloarcula californiae tailed virus 1]
MTRWTDHFHHATEFYDAGVRVFIRGGRKEMTEDDIEDARSRVEQWAEMDCGNAVRVNGCADEAPYYEMPWCEGPMGPYWFTERWCEACIEEMPDARIEDGEVVVDFTDNERIEYDEVRSSEITDDGNVQK